MKKVVFSTLFLALSLSGESIYFNQEVTVTSSTPEYQVVIEKTPYEECWNERVEVNHIQRSHNLDNVGGSIVGGIIGGVLGHQIGEGKGKDAATIGGAIIGSMMGGNHMNNHSHSYEPTYQNQRRCVTKYRKTRKREFMGYKNVAYYKGQKIIKYSDTPLKTIPLTITVSY